MIVASHNTTVKDKEGNVLFSPGEEITDHDLAAAMLAGGSAEIRESRGEKKEGE